MYNLTTLYIKEMVVVENGYGTVGYTQSFNIDEQAVWTVMQNDKNKNGDYVFRWVQRNKRTRIRAPTIYGDNVNIELMGNATYKNNTVVGKLFRARIPGITSGSVLLYYDSDLPEPYNVAVAKDILDGPTSLVLSKICGGYKKSKIPASNEMSSTDSPEYTATMKVGLIYAEQMHGKQKVKKGKGKGKKKKSADAAATSSATIPPPFVDRSKEKHDFGDDKETKKEKSIIPVDVMIGTCLTNLYSQTSQTRSGTDLSMDVEQNDDGTFTNKTLNAILPFGETSGSYPLKNEDEDGNSAESRWNKLHETPPTTVFFRRKAYPISLFSIKLCRRHNKGANEVIYTPVLLDTNNVLKRGPKQIYLLVSNHFSNDRLTNLANYCKENNDWDSFVVFIQILCAQGIYQLKGSNKNKSKLSGLSQNETNELVSFVERYLKAGMEGLLYNTDFEGGNVAELERIPWIGWNFMAWEFYNYVDDAMKARMHELMQLMWRRVMQLHPLKEGSKEFIAVFKEEARKAKMFHYLVIMAVSASKSDAACRKCYEKVMYMKYDARSFLEDIKHIGGFDKFYYVLVEILRNSSLGALGATLIVNLAVKSCIDCGGDIPTEIDLLSQEQIKDKKMRIALNTKVMTSGNIDDFAGVGIDTHVDRVFRILIKVWRTSKNMKNSLKESELKEYVKILVVLIDKNVGVYANELIGQLSQFINKGGEDYENKLDDIFRRLEQINEIYGAVNKEWRKTEVVTKEEDGGKRTTRSRKKH